MIIFIYTLICSICFYLVITLILFFVVQRFPRDPVDDKPDWGQVTDTKIPAQDGGHLEVWHVQPHGKSRGTIVLAHGWGRNRDRMVPRARIFAGLGFTTVMHSARDHGGSSPARHVNAVMFSQDIETVINWIGESVLLYGHSAGAAGAIIAAHENQDKIRLLFLEASYADTKTGLLSLYKWANWFFGTLFGPMIIFWWNLLYRGAMDRYSPINLAPNLKMPVMIIHGEKDRRFPLQFAYTLRQAFVNQQVDMYIGPGAGHSDSSLTPGYAAAVQAFIDCHI